MTSGKVFDPELLGPSSKPAWEAMVRYLEAPKEAPRRHICMKMQAFSPIAYKTCQTLINEALKLGIVQCVFKAGKGQAWYAAGPNHPTTPTEPYRGRRTGR